MKSYVIKMTLVILIISTLIINFKEKNKIIVNNTYINKITAKSELSSDNIVVYEGLTLGELSRKIDTQLNSTLDGYGKTIATLAIDYEVDPVVAASIILLETGCKWNCSGLVNSCNNIGGMRGSGCNGYAYFPTLEEGMEAFMRNLSNNYYKQGLTTPELMNKKYAESKTWASKVNKYVRAIYES